MPSIMHNVLHLLMTSHLFVPIDTYVRKSRTSLTFVFTSL